MRGARPDHLNEIARAQQIPEGAEKESVRTTSSGIARRRGNEPPPKDRGSRESAPTAFGARRRLTPSGCPTSTICSPTTRKDCRGLSSSVSKSRLSRFSRVSPALFRSASGRELKKVLLQPGRLLRACLLAGCLFLFRNQFAPRDLHRPGEGAPRRGGTPPGSLPFRRHNQAVRSSACRQGGCPPSARTPGAGWPLSCCHGRSAHHTPVTTSSTFAPVPLPRKQANWKPCYDSRDQGSILRVGGISAVVYLPDQRTRFGGGRDPSN